MWTEPFLLCSLTRPGPARPGGADWAESDASEGLGDSDGGEEERSADSDGPGPSRG
jgi:hypothetical protein